MSSDAQATRLIVLSDLHLAPSGEQCVFAADEALTSLIDHLAAVPPEQSPQWLVLNGDVFDYLQIPGYDALSLPLAPQRTRAILDALEAEPPTRNIVQALRRFTGAGHRLSCLPGNHDAELNLASVQQVLAERLGANTELPPSAGSWQLDVAGRRVIGCHGHHEDAFNAIGGARMRQAQADGDATVPMPPGSRLVCEVINPFRRAKDANGKKRFPFVDQLPSDHAVVLAIMLLDPRLAGKRLPQALGIGAAALVRRAMMMTGLRGPSLGAVSRDAERVPAGWVDELAGFVAAAQEGVSSTRLEYELDAYFDGASVLESNSRSALAGGGMVRSLLWRALGSVLTSARAAFRSDVADTLASRTSDGADVGVVLLTGHTHAPKCLPLPGGGIYLNTGTWLDQVIPPDDVSPDVLPDWLEQLQRNATPRWNGYPVAIVDGDGARLMSWHDGALQPWQDALS